MTETVTEGSIVRRVRRRLTKEGSRLQEVLWHSRFFRDTGRYVLHTADGRILCKINLELLARELGVLSERECIEKEKAPRGKGG